MDNIVTLPNNGYAPDTESVVAHLREIAQWIEDGEEAPRNIYMVLERNDGTLYRKICGQPVDLARTIGVLQMAIVAMSRNEL